MNTPNRIARLEKAMPTVNPDEEFCPNFNFRVAGRKRRDCQLEMIAALNAAVADRRATAIQRAGWKAYARQIEAALEPEEPVSP